MALQRFDIVVIGGGIVGVSAALHLARRRVGRIAILEKGPHVASGSTGQSSAVIRQRYSNLPLVHLAYCGLEWFRNWRERLEIVEDRSGFTPAGVVWITDEPLASLEASARMFREVGAAGGVCSVADLRDRYPSLNFCARQLDLSGHPHRCTDPPEVFWEAHAGFADPHGTTADLLAAALAKGAVFFPRHAVTQIETASGEGAWRVRCANGTDFSCGTVLNAAGPWCGRINGMVGVTLPMELRPARVQIAMRNRPSEVVGEIPVFVSTADQLYGRPEARGQQFIVGSTAPEDEREFVPDPDTFDTEASPEFRQRMMHKLHHHFAMKSRGTVHGYAGLYTVNTADWHPIIDAAGPPGFFVANGFSGHGFKLGPVIGALIAHRITGIRLPDDPPVDVRFFAADRQPIRASSGVLA